MTHSALIVVVALTSLIAALDAAAPSTDGLVLWLDASDAGSVQRAEDGRVTLWRDRSDRRNHASAVTEAGPSWVEKGINGRPAVRFSGWEPMRVESLAATPGNLTVFVVFERHPEQRSERKWQRLLSCWDGKSQGDNKFMIFDSETMGSWLGMPRDEDLPSTFSVEYVRAWKNPATRGDWRHEFGLRSDPHERTRISRYVRSMDGHGR